MTLVAEVDVLIVGAGISGISAAYHLGARCPERSFAIVEARERMGGTWDLFRYPGFRSDSQMYTLGFGFRPWTKPKAIADGASIREYVEASAVEFGIDRKIQYGKKVEAAAWSSNLAMWRVSVRDVASGAASEVTCRFLYLCAGYYEYESGYTPDFPGIESFRGRVVHPQKWTDDVDYAGRNVVVIGSGATAVTLVPELAKRAAHVTMLQRSPSFVFSVPSRDHVVETWQRRWPPRVAYALARWRYILLGMALYFYCRMLPRMSAKWLTSWAIRQMGGKAELEEHFSPSYKPWDQRLCIVPDGDLFHALHSGRASVVTDRIATFTTTGVRLESGRELQADLVVTATGLKMKIGGGIAVSVDGREIATSESIAYRGAMVCGVPNFATVVGYTNASWTLKSDLIGEFVCRVLNRMSARGHTVARPRPPKDLGDVEPVISLTSGYVQRALAQLPKQGRRAPWKVYQNYLVDLLVLRFGSIGKEMDYGQSCKTANGASSIRKSDTRS